jgi:hypothetical protein
VKVSLPRARATVLDEAGVLRISIPAKRRWFLILSLILWLSMWLYAGIAATGTQITREGEPPFFRLIWLVFWAAGSLFALYALLWMLAGREVVRVAGSEISLRREILGLGRSREFDAAAVRNFRSSVVPFNPWDPSSALMFWGLGGGTITFDYGPRTYRFGAGLDEAEAKSLAVMIGSRIPNHA